MGRKLALNRERLAALDTDELSHVVGAAPWTPWCVFIIGLQEEIARKLSQEGCR